MSIDTRRHTGLGPEDEFPPNRPAGPEDSDRSYWTPEQWLNLYLKEGLRIIPLYGSHDGGDYNPKKPGYPQWQKYVPSRDELLRTILHEKKMWGCVCGSVSGNLQIVDYDLYKLLDSREQALLWRKNNLSILRSLKTLVTFTPSGGFHVWLRTTEPKPPPEVISGFVRPIPLEMDLVRGDGGQAVVPPSKLNGVGNYWFMDDSKIRRIRKLGIRVI